MDHVKLYMLLEAHYRLLGLPALKNARAAVEAELQKIDSSLSPSEAAPKVVPATDQPLTSPVQTEIERKI